MARLYAILKHPSTGKKLYIPTIRGRHVLRTFPTATGAQIHAERLQARYKRLKNSGEVSRQPG